MGEPIVVRELAEVTRNVSLAVVLIGDNAKVVFGVSDDSIIFDIEFPKTVEGKCEHKIINK